MSTTRLNSLIKPVLTAGAVVLGLALSTGQLTAAGVTGSGSETMALAAPALGQGGTTSTPIYEDNSPDVFARAGAARDAFGFPAGSKRSGRHVHDSFQTSDYDEVDEIDSAGQPVSMTQFDGDGHLLTALRFDSPSPLVKTTSDKAVKTAQVGLTASGMAVSGQSKAEADEAAGGWDVHWPRIEAGYAVRGDETRVHVWQDGRIQSVARVEHKLAAQPARPLTQTDADQVVARQCDRWFAAASGYAIQGMDLEWVGPNAAFDPGKLGAASAPFRLAWVVNVKPSGPAADYLTLVTLYVDAGDGTVIGGDVVE